MKIASTTGANAVAVEGDTYHADEHGLFEVPEHIGQHLLRFAEWVPEHVRQSADKAAEDAANVDPHNLHERVAALEAKIVEHVDLIAKLTRSQQTAKRTSTAKA